MRPLLLLDVDGVLSSLGAAVPPGYARHQTDQYDVVVSQRHREWLRSLTSLFELTWATTWGESACQVFGTLLDLPNMDALDLGALPRDGTRKLHSVIKSVGDRPLAWVDDELYDDAFKWAATRTQPTLLIRTSGTVGLREVDVDQLRAFGIALAADPGGAT